MSIAPITSGTYTVLTSANTDGFLQYPNDTSKWAILAPEAAGNPAQQWTFEAAVANQSTFNIRSLGTGVYLTWRSAGDPLELIGFQSDVWPWYLRPGADGGEFYHVCYDESCNYVWAPYAQVEGNAENNTIRLAPRELTVGLDTQWRISPIPSSTETSTSSSASPTTTAATTGDTKALMECEPCGKEKCTFKPSGGASLPQIRRVIVAAPVTNCNAAEGTSNNQSIKSTVGGTYQLQRSFSVEVTAGIEANLGISSLSVSTTVSQSTAETRSQTYSIEITIPPGQVATLAANISYQVTPGIITVGDTAVDTISIQPGEVLGYDPIYTNCGSNFPAPSLPGTSCNAASSSRRDREVGRLQAWAIAFTTALLALGTLLS